MTRRQKELLSQLKRDGFIEHLSGFGTSQRNRPLWALVEMGLADFKFGPEGSWLQTQGFVPVNRDR